MTRDLELEGAWREREARHRKSGLTVREFCEREGLVPHQFTWWRRELKRRDAKARNGGKKQPRDSKRTGRNRPSRVAAPAAFVPVHVAASPSSESPIEIVMSQPPRIVVSAGFDRQLLSDVLRVLEERSC